MGPGKDAGQGAHAAAFCDPRNLVPPTYQRPAIGEGTNVGTVTSASQKEARAHPPHYGTTGIHLLHWRAPDQVKKQFRENTANSKKGEAATPPYLWVPKAGAQTLGRLPSRAHNLPGRD